MTAVKVGSACERLGEVNNFGSVFRSNSLKLQYLLENFTIRLFDYVKCRFLFSWCQTIFQWLQGMLRLTLVNGSDIKIEIAMISKFGLMLLVFTSLRSLVGDKKLRYCF